MKPFTYVVLRYVHDNAVGESLNVGVVLVAENGFPCCRVEKQTGRLSAAFRSFNASFHRQVLRSVERAVASARSSFLHGQDSLFATSDAGGLIRALWPDRGLNYQASSTMAGTAKEIEQAADALFERFIRSQEPVRRDRRRRTEEDVWKDVAIKLPSEVKSRLLPAAVDAGPFVFRFDHTYQNGNLHVVEPLSFDLLEADSVRDKALRWVGYASHLRPYIGTLNLVVGGPQQPGVVRAYDAALDVLQSVASVYEADRSDRLVHKLQELIN